MEDTTAIIDSAIPITDCAMPIIDSVMPTTDSTLSVIDTTTDSTSNFYIKAADYWSSIPATVDGMLGGFPEISLIDLTGSRNFLLQLFRMKDAPGKGRALDCGAGIGRVTKQLLAPIFKRVDLVEQDKNFIEKSKVYLNGILSKIGDYYNVGLQDFKPENNVYDLIWIQWVSGHLTDNDFIKFLNECRCGLKSNGVIVFKENVTSSGEIEFDRNDSSVTRPFPLLMDLIKKANYKCLRHCKQTKFPKALYTVYMIAIKPEKV